MLDPRRVLVRWVVIGITLSLSAGALCAAAASAVSRALASQVNASVVIAFLVGTALAAWRMKPSFNRNAVARHLNSAIPEFESSAHLLLRDTDSLNAVERIQLDRIRSVEASRLPTMRALVGLLIAATALALSTLIPPLVNATPVTGPASTGTDASGEAIEIRARAIVRPPQYTGMPERETSLLDLEAPEGSRVSILSDNAAHLVVVGGDTVPFVGGQAELRATASMLYYLRTDVAQTPLHRLRVVIDAPPSVSLINYDRRTLIDLDTLVDLRFAAVVEDDHGVAGANLVATITSGDGEAVKFRELTRALSPGGGRYATSLDVTPLGLTPGDEMYFHLEAVDNRPGRPQLSRTETYFLAVPDTGRVLELNSDGILLNPLPQAFLSQRQLIADTERLAGRRDSLAARRFNQMSNGLASIQSQLRLRYGQFLGEEVVDEEELVGAEGHDHDTEEGATFYIAEIKRKVRQVLRYMWESELELGQYRPEASLPAQYRALALLQELQDMYDRVYVLRIGFEAPPVRPEEKRLTGDLDEVARPTAVGSAEWVRDQVALRELHSLLDAVKRDDLSVEANRFNRGLVVLGEIAAGSSDDAAFAAAKAIQQYLDDRDCGECIDNALRELRRVLPPSDPVPARSSAGGWFGKAFAELREQS